MYIDDPLEAWLTHDEATEALRPTGKKQLADVNRALDELEAMIAKGDSDGGKASGEGSSKKKSKVDFGVIGRSRARLLRLPDATRARAEALYPKLFATRGTGKQSAEEWLLTLIGYTGDPASVPFFVETLALGRAGDTFAKSRRKLLLSGLAITAIRNKDQSALDALHSAATHENPDVRADAILTLGSTALDEGGPIDATTAEVIVRAAAEDPAFAPRFLARGLVMASGIDLPPPDAQQILALEVTLGVASRTIEMRASHTLDELAREILDAFGWDDHEHLYAFHMTNDVKDPRFELSPFDEEEAEDEEFGEALDQLAAPFDLDKAFALALEREQTDGEAEETAATSEDAEDAAETHKANGVARNGTHPTNGEGHRHVHSHGDGHDHAHDDDDGEDDLYAELDENAEGEEFEDEEFDDIPLGHLGLPSGHEFLFRYDFADDNRFQIKVLDGNRRAEPEGEYPRVVERKGRAPSQHDRD